MRTPADTRGFTLIEITVMVIVLAVALTGVTIAINRAVLQSPEALIQARAMQLAQAYLDEILMKRFDEHSAQGGIPRCSSVDNLQQACTTVIPSSDPGENNRLDFDDVDDYHSLDEQPPQSISGTTLTNLSNYADFRVRVSVSFAGTELGFADNTRAKRITVNVVTPLGNTIPVSAYRVNF